MPKYRLAINLGLMPLDDQGRPVYRGLDVSHTTDLEVADLREASNVLIEFHDLCETIRARLATRYQ